MSFIFGKKSTKELNTLHPLFQQVFLRVLETDDHSIDQGGRTDKEQWDYYYKGTSTLHPPAGKHLLKRDLTNPADIKEYSFAADVTPWIKGKRLVTSEDDFGLEQAAQFTWFLRKVYEVGKDLLEGSGWELRFGINWDGDAEILTDQNFDDWFHIEMVRC